MSRKVEIEVFQYNELSPVAQGKARDWFRELIEADEYADDVIDDAAHIADCFGIEFDTHPVKRMSGTTRAEFNVWWSGFGNQGDGALFEGRWTASKVQPGLAAQHAPEDMHIARLEALFVHAAQSFPGATFTVKKSNMRYTHAENTDFSVNLLEDHDTLNASNHELRRDVSENLVRASRTFMNWIYARLQQAHDYATSDETVAENILANEYDFTAAGKRFG